MVVCEHCGREFALAEARGTYNEDFGVYRCPHCREPSRGPPPE